MNIKKGNKYYMSDEAGIYYAVETPESINKPPHTHEYVEFAYMLKGKCTHIIDGKEYEVSPGDMVVINYDQTHEIRGNMEVRFINVWIKPHYINKNLKNHENVFSLLDLNEFSEFSKILDMSKGKVTFTRDEREKIEKTISIINREMTEKAPGYELAIYSQLNFFLVMSFRKMSLRMDVVPWGINDELLIYISKHCHENLELDDLAKMCSYNTSYFSRKFKEFSGLSYREYLKRIRLEKAVALLENTDIKISDVIEQVGYTDRTKFFSHFSEFTGTTPLKYRKGNK